MHKAMRFYRFLHICFLLICAIRLQAQSAAIDSLKNLVKTAKADTSQVNRLNVLTDKIWQTGNYDSAMVYAHQSTLLAEKLNFKHGLATAQINTALIHWKQGNYPKGIDLCFKALKINEGIHNQKGAARALNAIGLIYFSQKNYAGALEKYEASLAIREKIKDEQGISGSLNNIGEVYKTQGQTGKALAIYERALEMNRKSGNRNWEAININNMALIYREQAGMFPRGDVQQKTYFEKAITHYSGALKIRNEINDRQGIALSGLGLGVVYTQLGKFGEAEKYLDNALSIARQIGYREAEKDVYLAKMRLDSTRGSWNGAYKNHWEYIRLRDSLINEESTRKSVRAEMNFDFEKKEHAARLEQEKKDALAAEEKQRQNIIIISVSIILAIVLILALVIFRSLRLNQQKNKIITAQKAMVEEKQREITDSINYAERLQRSLLANKKMLDQHLEDYFIYFNPKEAVSGDFYWASTLSNGHFLLVVADSTGHGVPGAIMSMMNMNSLKESVREGWMEADQLMNETRKIIIATLANDGSSEGGKDGMDAALLVFDPQKNNVSFSLANNPLWLVRPLAGSVPTITEYKADKMPVGKHDKQDIPFTKHTINLQKGDMIYVFTDGYADQFGGPGGKKYKYSSLQKLIMRISHEPLSKQEEILAQEFEQWKGDTEQIDDVCILGIKL